MIDTILRWVTAIVILGQQTSISVPVFTSQVVNAGFGRNIRHLPCVSRRTGENGVCMFAYSCVKANGTHLGTCIDRFYFGSCCKLSTSNLDLAAPLDTNNISEETFIGLLSTEGSLVKNSSLMQSQTSPRPDILLPDRKPPKPLISTTQKPFIAQTFNISSSTSLYSKSTESPTVVTHSTYKPTVQNIITSLYNYSKPTKKPLISSNLSPKPSNKPILVSTIKPDTSYNKPVISKPVKPSLSTTISSPTKQPDTKPTSASQKPLKPISVIKPKPPISNSNNKIKPSNNKPNQTSVNNTKLGVTKKPVNVTSTSQTVTIKPPVKITRPTNKPSTSVKPLVTKPGISTKQPPNTVKPTSKPQYVSKPATSTSEKPTVPSKPIESIPSNPSTPPYTKVTISSTSMTTISNEIVPILTNFTTISSIELEERLNVTNGTPSQSTEIPQTLVTWTTIEEVHHKPTYKPSSASSTVISNSQDKIKIPSTSPVSTTIDGWVEVPVSTLENAQPKPGPTKPSILLTTPEVTSTISTPLPTNTTETTSSPTSTSIQATDSSLNTTITTENYLEANYTDIQSFNEIDSSNLNISNYVDVCGRRLFPQSRVVGGEKATFGKWPWQISLRQWRTSTYLHKCGAALLNENWAITAAHCVENVPPSDFLLRLGEHDLSLEDEPYGYQERRVQIVASHPQFDSRTFEYDLALLRFYEPVTFQPNIIPVCVPQDDTNFVGSTAFVTGWGRLYEDGPLPSVLQEVSVPVINNTVCEAMYRAAGYIEHIPEIFICAGRKKGGFDSCEGDSGGPMVIQRPDKRWLLAGVISWGIGCAEPNQPGVYTRISEFREWINQILQF